MCGAFASTLVAVVFFFNDPATTEIYTLSLHDALPIHNLSRPRSLPHSGLRSAWRTRPPVSSTSRSEEHTSELQSQSNLVCRLLLEKKKKPGANQGPRHNNNTR